MPWTAKQLKLFRAAAHNPAIAKSSGIKKSDAERMSKEGLKKMAHGGIAQQKINKQNTRHGAVDLPVANLNRFAGMKKGGMMKTRRFAKGGLEDEGFDKSGEGEDTVYRKSFAGGVKMSDEAPAPKTAPAAKPALRNYGDEKDSGPKEDTGPYRTMRPVRSADKPSEAQQNKNAERMGKIGEGAAALLPIGKVAKGVEAATRGAKVGRDALKAASDSNEAKFIARRAAERATEAKTRKQVYGGTFRQGGLMKESKAMTGKEVAFMKKKGAPASMIKHEKAEMGMKKGGMPMKDGKPSFMKKFAKGGGIESRGKTKGTVIRMASGGSVSSASRRADGIAQRGKTRC